MWRRSEKWRLSQNSGQEMPSALWPHLHSRSCFVVSGARAAHPTAAGPLAPLCRLPHVILGHSWCSGRLWGPEAAGAGVGRRMASSPADRAAACPPTQGSVRPPTCAGPVTACSRLWRRGRSPHPGCSRRPKDHCCPLSWLLQGQALRPLLPVPCAWWVSAEKEAVPTGSWHSSLCSAA